MKSLFFAAAMALTVLSGFAAEKPVRNPLFAGDSVVWTGLDCSKVRMIGPGQFNTPEIIFPGMLHAWNDLFLAERLPSVEKETRKRVLTDIGGVNEANNTATSKQIITEPGPEDTIEKSHLTPVDIAQMVKAYKLKSPTGLGVVFIVDRLVKVDGNKPMGALYVVFFDLASREVLSARREVAPPGGFGFRNYWFGVIKRAERGLQAGR